MREIELSEAAGLAAWRAQGLRKGAGHKYIRRVPKPGGGYRYYYRTSGVTRGVGADLVPGAKFKLTHEGQPGHFEVVRRAGDRVVLKHDESGASMTVSAEALGDLLKREHADVVNTAKERLKRDIEAARKHGSPKQIARLEAQARRFGFEDLAGREHADSGTPAAVDPEWTSMPIARHIELAKQQNPRLEGDALARTMDKRLGNDFVRSDFAKREAESIRDATVEAARAAGMDAETIESLAYLDGGLRPVNATTSLQWGDDFQKEMAAMVQEFREFLPALAPRVEAYAKMVADERARVLDAVRSGAMFAPAQTPEPADPAGPDRDTLIKQITDEIDKRAYPKRWTKDGKDRLYIEHEIPGQAAWRRQKGYLDLQTGEFKWDGAPTNRRAADLRERIESSVESMLPGLAGAKG